jgi:FO synthase
MGPDGVKTCLRAGANDLGGTLMDETITRSAGAAHGQEMTPAAMEAIIRSVGRLPRQRDTLYSEVSDERYRASFSASGVIPAVASAAITGMRGHLASAGRESYCSNDSTIL